ncbi:ATP-dependent RNA helicase A-like [Penaeus indicus]|uniref:ATP-dependent RNA helicase A-like n=1 Tax=Penaeus indicus TaxID=29960 RepID=UPI00300CB8AC
MPYVKRTGRDGDRKWAELWQQIWDYEDIYKVIYLSILSTYGIPQGYHLPDGDGFSHEEEYPGGNDGPVGGCKEGEILHVDGTCTTPIITRKVYLYDAPDIPVGPIGPPPSVPPPKVDRNVFLVSLPEKAPPLEPIIVPPPRQTSIVYVLNKKEIETPKLIEVNPPPASNPEVYFVNYQEGENPTLPLGVDLETALSVATEAGEVLGVAGGFGDAADGFNDGLGGGTGFDSDGLTGDGGFVGGAINGFVGSNGGAFGINGGHANAGGGGAGVSEGFGATNGGIGAQTPSGLYSGP